METGDNGASGVHALSPVNRESSLGNENVTHQLQNMVVRHVKETRGNTRSATKRSPVQVFRYI